MEEREFQKKSLFSRVPVIITPTFKASGVVPCLKYIASLVPARNLDGSPDQVLEVDQWLSFSLQDIKEVLARPTSSISRGVPCTGVDLKKSEDYLARIDSHLKLRTFLVGNQLTIADICIYFNVSTTFMFLLTQEQAKQIPHLIRWFKHLNSLPGFEKCRRFNGPPPKPFPLVLSEATPKAEDKKKPEQTKGKPEQAKGKPEQAKPAQKQQPKKEEPKPQLVAAAPKVDPLTLLAPSKMLLDKTKFDFLNQPNKELAFQNFWENFDKEGWSFWHLHYEKAEGEGEVVYRTSNLMNGFLQKNDNFRKWCLGVHGVYGEEPKLEIRGVWMWRGTEIPDQIKDLDQYEYYKWRKLCPEADRKLIEEYWKGLTPGTIVDGLKVQDAVYFK